MDIAADLDIVFGELADAATSVLDRSEVIRSSMRRPKRRP